MTLTGGEAMGPRSGGEESKDLKDGRLDPSRRYPSQATSDATSIPRHRGVATGVHRVDATITRFGSVSPQGSGGLGVRIDGHLPDPGCGPAMTEQGARPTNGLRDKGGIGGQKLGCCTVAERELVQM